MLGSIIDVDDPTTWPSHVAQRVCKRARQLAGVTRYTTDLPVLEEEDEFRALLRGHHLRAYHCTRLLDHELVAIRKEGLRPLTPDLISDRLRAALASRDITRSERHVLLAGHVFATNEHGHRDNQVCLILSRSVMDERPFRCEPLLATWGGEGIYMSSGTQPLSERLAEIGKAAIVVAAIDLSDPQSVHPVFPGVFKTFLGVALSLENRSSDVFYKRSVPPSCISAIWQPGDPEYDRHAELPCE